MEKTIQVYNSFEEADEAEIAYYASLSPNERVDLLLDIIAAYREAQGEAASRFERVYRIVDLAQS